MSKRDYINARKYFGLNWGDGLVLHHKDPTMKYNDPERYGKWNPDDLEVMTKGDHARLHNKLNPRANCLPGHPVSKETRRKIGAANKGNQTMLGKHHTDEAKAKIGASKIGKQGWSNGLTKETDERVKHISEALAGKIISDETKQKMSAAKKGGTLSAEHSKHIAEEHTGKPRLRKVRCIETNEVFECMKLVCEKYNVYHASLRNAIKNGTTIGGYHWEYI